MLLVMCLVIKCYMVPLLIKQNIQNWCLNIHTRMEHHMRRHGILTLRFIAITCESNAGMKLACYTYYFLYTGRQSIWTVHGESRFINQHCTVCGVLYIIPTGYIQVFDTWFWRAVLTQVTMPAKKGARGIYIREACQLKHILRSSVNVEATFHEDICE